MKKITLSIGLIASILSASGQDTICTQFKDKEIISWDYQVDTILSKSYFSSRFHTIDVGYNEVLVLDLSDTKARIRKVIVTHPDGEVVWDILDSDNHEYVTPVGPLKVQVGKKRFIIGSTY